MATEVKDQAEKRKKLVVIDGKSVFYRGYYAMSNLSTKDGTPTGGIFGFATMALEVIRRLKPDYVAVAWDKPKTNIRKRLELYPEYKAGRKPAPPDFYEQIPLLHELLDAFGWPLYELDDYEADDIMGALAVQASEKGLETLLVTSDMDMLQLVNGNVHVYALKTGLSNIELYSPKSFEVKYGIKVEQFLDLKAIKGDSSDNIPGVPGIGEKGAVDLLNQFETLDGIYDNLALIKDSTRKKLEAGKELAYLSKELARIWIDAPLKLDLDRMDGRHMNPEKVLELLQKLEFRTLARQLPDIMQVKIADHHASSGNYHLSSGKTTVIKDLDDLAKLKFEKTVYIHSRCKAKHGRKPQYLVLSNDAKQTYVIDIKALGQDKVAAKLTDVKELIGYDVKSSLKVLIELGLKKLPSVKYDVLVGDFLIDSLNREQSLSDIASRELGYDGSPFDDLDDEEFVTRASEITAIIKALYAKQDKELEKLPELNKLAKDVEWPVIPVLARMEYTGVLLNSAYLEKFSDEIDDMISDLKQKIYGFADQEFNISSPGQLAEILFEKLNLPTDGIKKGKTGYSTAASELDKLRSIHPVIDVISQYREVTKLKNTYIDTLPKMVDDNSRLHTTFSLTTAQTGRLSSSDPNLQNIPIKTELGKRIRTAFEADKGRVLISADYSQFELRLAAALSGEEELIKLFNNHADVHIMTAAQIYERDPEDVTKQMRRAAKTINFGVLYGQGPHALSQSTGMDFKSSKNFIDRFFEIRPKLKEFIKNTREQADKQGYVETLLGRRRPTPDVKSSNFAVREAAYRAAVNLPIQGTAADIMKLAMIKVDQALKENYEDCEILLQIHDSLLVECPEAKEEEVSKTIQQTMEEAYKLPVEIAVEVDSGKNWGEI